MAMAEAKKSMKFITLTLKVDELRRESIIAAGTMFLWPHVDRFGAGNLPPSTIMCCGQWLSRELYPEIAFLYTDTGDFYNFQLPNLEGKFLLGFDEHGHPMMASGCIYYETVKHGG